LAFGVRRSAFGVEARSAESSRPRNVEVRRLALKARQNLG